jgi:rod shape-determining protein MreC
MNPIHSDAVPVFMKRGWMPVWRLGAALTLSFILMTIDARFTTLQEFRRTLTFITFPLQHIAAIPQHKWWNLSDWFSTQSILMTENQRLQNELLQAASIRTELDGLKSENEELRALLNVRTPPPITTTTATFLYRSRIPAEQKIIIDQGEKEDIKPGQAVGDSQGIIGQVTRVYPFLSEVTLLTNKGFSTPIKIARTGVFGLIFGRGLGQNLELSFATQDMDVKEGDILVTSGIDGVYPPNLPVAKVHHVQRKSDTMFMHVECTPLAQLNRHRYMLLFSLPSIRENTTPVPTPTPLKSRRR